MQRALLVSLIGASYLLFAGGPRWTLGPLLLIAVFGVLVAPARTLAFPRAWRALDLWLCALVLGVVFQLIPLPAPAVGLLSPNASRVRQALHLVVPGSPSPGWRPLSLNPEDTAYALGTVVLGVLSFLIARAVFSAGGSSRRFCRALAIFGAAVALLALVQKVLTPTMVLGILQPEVRSANPLGAFINRNHFAAWLLLVTTVACGYLIAHLRIHPAYQQRWRTSLRQFLSSGALPTAMSAAITTGTLIATLSRSAMAGFAAAGMTGWWFGRSRMQIERTSLPTVLGLAGLAALTVVVFVDVDGWATRIGQSFSPTGALGFSRPQIWRETLPIIRDFPLTGTGAGTYSDVMTEYQQTRLWMGSMQSWFHFNNAHSHFVQVASEGGLLLLVPTLACLTLLASLGRRAIQADKGEMFWVRVSAAAGLVGLAVQSVWEIALVMPANAVLAGALAGLLLYRRDGRADPSTADLRPNVRPRMA